MRGNEFEGERVLVTGASRGIGFGIAEAFARAGATLAILAEDAGVDAAAEALGKKAGRPVFALRCDITDRAAVARVFAGIERQALSASRRSWTTTLKPRPSSVGSSKPTYSAPTM